MNNNNKLNKKNIYDKNYKNINKLMTKYLV